MCLSDSKYIHVLVSPLLTAILDGVFGLGSGLTPAMCTQYPSRFPLKEHLQHMLV
jgi:hypothetical protein